METLTTIRNMTVGREIIVPDYQRAYSWDTPNHTDVFLSDLEEHYRSNTNNKYYFGHFLFEERDGKFYIIDGQQRLTTIVIFLSALFTKLRTLRELSDNEEEYYEDIVKRRNTFRLKTVEYDNQLFADYVINQTAKKANPNTESSKRIVKAFDSFKTKLSNKREEELIDILLIIINATCTTHQVENESEAIQMFIFQNSRGKRPSNLEIMKAQFMHYVHLHGRDREEIDSLLKEIKERFEKIYKAISAIEYKIDEDDVLSYTLRFYSNSLLGKENPLKTINSKLADENLDNTLDFIKDFTRSLSYSFEYLSSFFGVDQTKNFAIRSLISLGRIGLAFPFIIKAYSFGLQRDEIGTLCSSLESLILRHRLIGTRAEIIQRIDDVFEKFQDKNHVSLIVDHVEWMKTTTQEWWAYWNNNQLEAAIQGDVESSVAKFLLWKYEIYLEQQGNAGYSPTRFDDIKSPELEHIAPRTEPNRPHGYDDFKNNYLNCLGNYLLLSKSHNCGVGNIKFSEKRATYIHNAQQR